MYGAGAIGKSLLIQQYATAAATGRDFLGLKTRPAQVMGFFCEDAPDELHRRQIDINRSLGVSFEELQNLRITSRRTGDNLLATWNRSGEMQRSELWQQLVNDAQAFRADVVVVDTLADIFAGSEIDRAQVSSFMKACLGRMAQEVGGTVIALGHPSQSGLSSGEGISGSTAWSNAARSNSS